MKHTQIILVGSLCMICLLLGVMPVAAAPANGTEWNSNPEHIAAMQAHVAYAGAKGQAQMDGAISYIGTISNGAGTSELSSIESQFTGTVSSVQSMTTADQIKAAETQMKTDRTSFMTSAKESVRQYNGTEKALAQSINASVMAQSATLQALEDTWWTDRQTSRMDEFATNDERRNGMLSNLMAKGVDVSQAQAVETQIQQEGTVLDAALTSRDEKAIKAANEQLATLDKQFVTLVQGDEWTGRETTRLAAFDKEAARMQGELANLTAKGVDVSQAQAVLTQIGAERDPLKAALDAHDATTLKTVNAQIKTLDTQFLDIVKGYRAVHPSKKATTPVVTPTAAVTASV